MSETDPDADDGGLDGLRHCLACGQPELSLHGGKELRCAQCGFRYFHNVAAAVAVVLEHEGRFLFACRAHAPAQGAWDFPGGFVDPDETLEEAACRELREELAVDLTPIDLRYLFSSHNRYPFASVAYRTADVYFGVRLRTLPALHCADDVSEARWWRLEELPDAALSFDTVRAAVARLRAGAFDAAFGAARA
ncbi:MAG TPA: NUDIX domain-containing protein [Pseudomonadales bacterium]|nr:NUDIX domain-containing protein [Pseudomonadales bacterium]